MALGERGRRERATAGRRRDGGGGLAALVETRLQLDTVPVPMLVLDAHGRVVEANTHATVLLGRPGSQMRTMTAFELLGRDVLWSSHPGGSVSTVSSVDLPTGLTARVILSVGSLGASADAPHTVVVLTPVPAVAVEHEHAAPEVRNFNDVAEMVGKLPGDALCVAIGVMGLQSVNDSFSRSSGDTALATIETRIQSASPTGAVIVRTGGDRFVVVAAQPEDPRAVIATLTAAVRAPIPTALGDVALGCAVGVTVGSCRSSRVLLDRAFRNLDAALARGASSVEWRDVPRSVVTRPLGRLAVPLLRVLARDGISAEFQPVVALSTGGIVEYEATPRWDDHSTEPHSAEEMIRAARDIGALDELGVSVLRRSLELCARLKVHGDGHVRVSVNVGTSALALERFASRTLEMIAAAGVESVMLQIEVTAHDSTIDAEHVRGNVDRLRSEGVRFALRLGRGAADLFTVRDLGFDSIKIKAARATESAEHGPSAMLLAALEFARRIGADAVVKGVETLAHHDVLRRSGCAYGQGGFYERPRSASEVIGGDQVLQLPAEGGGEPEFPLRPCPPVRRVLPTYVRVAVASNRHPRPHTEGDDDT